MITTDYYNKFCKLNLFNGEIIKKRLMTYEGFSQTPYYDIKQWTWGYGTRVPFIYNIRRKLGNGIIITYEEAEHELEKYIINAYKYLYKCLQKNMHQLNHVRREAFIDMIYNIGSGAFFKFKKMRALLEKVPIINWTKVALELADSKYYTKDNMNDRVKAIIHEVHTGKYFKDYEKEFLLTKISLK
ncbi:MAG: glycoside hydrolase family protein [Candidatus Hodarchaeota archaeon]